MSSASLDDADLLTAARAGDDEAFAELTRPWRAPLGAYCYRMLGSTHEADDAVQETMLAAWRGLSGYEGTGAFKSWLYQIATRTCIHSLRGRKGPRLLSIDQAPSATSFALGDPLPSESWVEPFLEGRRGEDDPYSQKEGVELAMVAAMQHLPPRQRAVLILREGLVYQASEVAEILQISVGAVESALQRARKAVKDRVPAVSQQDTLARLGEQKQRELVEQLVEAWTNRDVSEVVGLLAEDARFTMPPLATWFSGRSMIQDFVGEMVFSMPWRVQPTVSNGQLALLCEREDSEGWDFGALIVLTLTSEGQVGGMDCFLDPGAMPRDADLSARAA